MGNGNNHSPETTPLIELGYNNQNMMVMVVNGVMEDNECPFCHQRKDSNLFKAMIQLTRPQAWKLTEDIKFTMNEMEKEKM